MRQKDIIQKTENFVKQTLQNAEGGHDWFHIDRVRRTALGIAQSEKADVFIVELGALLHDIADSKFHDGNEDIGPEKAKVFLKSIQVEENIIDHIENIIRYVSFKSGFDAQTFTSKELEVIQDADRLDAMGAIGIARAFNYGGFKNRALYNPDIEANLNMNKEAYKKSKAPTINHFYEKLLLLKDRMNTAAGKKMAEERHQFMEMYLEQFYKEWNVT
jgi:uncharacterized protein